MPRGALERDFVGGSGSLFGPCVCYWLLLGFVQHPLKAKVVCAASGCLDVGQRPWM